MLTEDYMVDDLGKKLQSRVKWLVNTQMHLQEENRILRMVLVGCVTELLASAESCHVRISSGKFVSFKKSIPIEESADYAIDVVKSLTDDKANQ